MKAVLIGENKSLVLSQVPDPVIGEEECLIRVEAAGVNRADLLQREGNYPPPPGCPEWMGLEIAGRVVKMGKEAEKKCSFREGDAVCALLGGGGYAEYAAVRYDALMPVPRGCDMVEAAALPEAFATSYLNLFLEGGAKQGETLLVTAGASGLASVMIPMAKAFGLRVITTVRHASQAERIASLGADRIVLTTQESLTQVLRNELEAGHGVDLAIDCLGGEEMGDCLPFLNRGARWIMIASLAGAETKIDLRNLFARGIRIIGSTLRSRSPRVKAEILKALTERIWPLVEEGKIRPILSATFPLQDAEMAQEVLYRGGNVGKVVLTVEAQ